MKLSTIAAVVGLAIASSSIGTGAYLINDTRAIAHESKQIAQLTSARLDNKIIQDKIDWLEFKIEELLAKYGSYDRMPPAAQAWFRSLQKQLRDWRTKQKGGN